MSKSDLKLDWCSHAAAKYAVMHWHYSKRMPKFKQAYVGVWEAGQYIGAVIFGLSVTPYLGDKFGLVGTECAELTRIALSHHQAPVSRIASIAIRLLAQQSPGLRLLISYADPNQGHHGGIYQAMGWVYLGPSSAVRQYFWRGQWRNDSSMFRAFKKTPRLRQSTPHRDLPPKHKYALPLDAEMRQQIESLRQPYPKRAGGVDCTAGDQPEGGGSQPTPALHIPRKKKATRE